MSNVHIIIQARMGSGRVPGKVLKDLSGFPVLYHVVERCRKAQKADDIIVATTTLSGDDVVVDFCKESGISYFRGSEDNVLKRYYDCARHFESCIIVRVCSDCPLIDPFIVDECIKNFYKIPRIDYISNILIRTFPRGLDVEVFSFDALERAHNNAQEKYEKEHVTPFIWENKRNEFNVGEPLRASSEYARNYRLTVDYPEDFEFMEKIYGTFYEHGKIISVLDVISFLDSNPDIANINAHCGQKFIK